VPDFSVSDVRFQKLGKVWSQEEIDALWGVLAFFSSPKSTPCDNSLVRWQVVSSLFSCGVLAADSGAVMTPKDLPPSDPQLLACEKDIGCLARILSRGSLDVLPNTESLLINLIRRSLTLQGDVYLGNEESRANCFPSFPDGKAERKLVSRLWKATHPLFYMVEGSVRSHPGSVFDVSFQCSTVADGVKMKNLLMPSSNLLRSCLRLLQAWIRRVPGKKVRQSRLIKSLKSLRESLMGQANTAESEFTLERSTSLKSCDSFEAAFAPKPSKEIGHGLERRSIFFREAAAVLKIVEVLSKEYAGGIVSGNNPIGFCSKTVNEVRVATVYE
jgi:hypothetical protein